MSAFTVFQGVNFYLEEVKLRNLSEVKQLLKAGGAMREYYMGPLVTHVITDEPLSDGTLSLVNDASVPVLHSDWVRMSSKCGVQLPTTPFEVNVAKLFSGLVFCLSKLSRCDSEKLCVMLMYYGGRIQRHLDRNVTHLVTMVTTGLKYEAALKHAVNVATVTPKWVLDCIESGRLQEAKVYHPSHLQQTEEQKSCNGGHDTVTFQLGKGSVSLATPSNQGDPLATPSNGDTPLATPSNQGDPLATPSNGGDPLATPSNRGDPLTTSINRGDPLATPINGGDPLATPSNRDTPLATPINGCDMTKMEINPATTCVMGPAGSVVLPSSSEAKGCGEREEAVVPMDTGGKVQQQPQVGSLEDSQDLGHLTKVPVMADTHVALTIDPETAPLEQPLPQPVPQLLQGLVFVVKGYQEHLDEGTVRKWKEVIIQYGGDVVEKYDSLKVTHLLALHKNCPEFDMAFNDGKCIASAHWLNDVLLEQKLFPPCHALHFPTYFRHQLPGADQLCITLTNYSDAERELVKDMIRATGVPYTGHLSNKTTHLICKTPFGKKYERACEWGIKVVNASFLSEIIHNGQIPAILYPRHTKLGSADEFCAPFYEAVRLLKPWQSFMAGYASHNPQWVNQESTGKAFSVVVRAQEEQGMCVQLAKREDQLCGEAAGGVELSSSVQLPAPCVVFTGINVQLLGHLKKVVLQLGGRVTESVNECTHLVASRIARTVKFLCGISVCKHIVMPQWLDQCNQMNRFVDETPYVLHDSEAEDLFSMSVPSSLLRARQVPLLKGMQLFSTAKVSPPFDSLRDIIRYAGGELLDDQELRNRFGRTLERVDQNHPLVVISCHEDVEHGRCTEFFARNIAVYNPEFILTGVLRQQLEYNQNQLFQSSQL